MVALLAMQTKNGSLQPDALMFDLDGTLIDTMGGFADVAAQVMQEDFGMALDVARRRYLETSGIPFRQQLDVIFPQDARNDQASDTFEHRKRGIAAATNMPDDTAAALEQLRAKGIKVIVSSNSAQHFVDEFADRTGFAFDLALGFGGGLAKGTPHVQKVCAVFNLQPGQILFVGDSLKDGELAAENGLPFVGRTGTFSREHFAAAHPQSAVIDGIPELLALLA